jgi:hypothetical protein
MQLDRLLSRIRSALQDYASEFEQRALAAEYAELCARAALRLEQMIPLIRSGQDYAALQIAEAPPPVLDLVRQLSFAEAETWRAFCQRRGLPVAQPFDERNVDLANQLYGKKISETHPLYRDYRQAIRTRQEQQALRILQSIRRVNPDDANAHAEYTRLARKLHAHKSAELAAALDQNNTPAALTLMESIEADGSVGNDFDPVWQRAVQLRKDQEVDSARARCLAVAEQLRALRESEAWQDTLPLLAEWDSLRSQYSLGLPPEVEEATAAIRQWASTLLAAWQHEDDCQRRWKSLSARLEELAQEKPRRLPDKIIAAYIDDLQDRATALGADNGATPPELLAALDAQLALLRATARRRRSVRLVSAAAAVAILLLVTIFFTWRHARERALEAQAANLRQLLAQRSYGPLSAAMKTIDANYSDLSNDPNVAPLLAQAHAFLASQQAVHDRFTKELAQLDQAAAANPTPAQLAALLDSLNDLDKHADDLGPESAAAMRASLADRRVRWTQTLTRVQEQRANQLADIAARVDQAIDAKLAQASSAETASTNIDQVRLILAEADKIPPDPSHATDAEQAARARLDAETQKLTILAAAATDALAARQQLAQARSYDEYRAPLERLAINPLVGDPYVAAAHAFVDRKTDWNSAAQAMLLPGEPQMWAFLANLTDVRLQPVDDAQNEDIAFSRLVTNDILGNIYRAKLVDYVGGVPTTQRDVFLAGNLTEQQNDWDKNSEIRQTGNVINRDGSTTIQNARWVKFDGQSSHGNLFENAQLAPESALVIRLHQAYDSRSEGIREPLLRVLDDVRADPASSPVLKAYLQQELLKIIQNRPYDWGLAFSPSALADSKQLALITGGNLQPADWLFPDDPHLVDNLTAFFKTTASHHYYTEATLSLQNLLSLHAKPILFAGYVDLAQKPALDAAPAGAASLWGVDTTGVWRILFNLASGQPTPSNDAPTPAPLTPLLYTK